MNEKGYIPTTPMLSTAGIGLISGLWGPISIGIGLLEVLFGYYLHFKKKSKWGAPLFAGGLIATFMGIGETMWGAMSASGMTTRASLSGLWKIMYPAAYGFEWISKLFAPKVPTFTPTPESAIVTGLRTLW